MDGKDVLDIENYRSEYYQANVPGVKNEEDMERYCHEYLEGMQWVMTYYTQGVPNWRWRFRHHYAPFSSTLAEHVSTFSFSDYSPSSPTLPFVQLLGVLPPKSSLLLPSPLDSLLGSADSVESGKNGKELYFSPLWIMTNLRAGTEKRLRRLIMGIQNGM